MKNKELILNSGYKITEEELKAVKKGLDYIGVKTNDVSYIKELCNNGTITINTANNSKDYAWIIWSDSLEVTVDIETLEICEDKEKINEMFNIISEDEEETL